MEISPIPPKLLEKYNLSKDDHIKYSFFEIPNFENEVNKENSMLNSLKTFDKSLENIFSKISEFISTNKNTFNDTCNENGVKSLDYLFLIKSTQYLVETIISKLENHEPKTESFQSIYDSLNSKFQKIFEIQYPNSKTDVSLIKDIQDTTQTILDYSEEIKKAGNKPGIIITSTVTFYNVKYIVDLNDAIKKFEEIKEFKDSSFFNNQTKSNEIILFNVLLLLKRLKNMNQILYSSYLLEENDLMNKKEDSQEWNDVKKLLWIVRPKKDIDINKKMEEMSKKMFYRMSQMGKMREGGKLQMIGNMVSNLFSSDQGVEHEAKKALIKLNGFKIEPPKKTMQMNMMMKKMLKIKYPKIEFRKKLYIRKEYKNITSDYIKELNDFLNGKITEPKDKNIFLFNNDYTIPDSISKKQLFSTQLEKNEKDFYVSTRLMNNKPLIFKGESNTSGIKNEFNNTLLIHITGGGFRSNNAFMMEKYLRQWSIDMGVAVMIIKKPEKDEDVYPETLNYFYQVYMWLMDHAKDELNMDIKKIIFSGDSSGGNLALSFLYLIIGIKLFEKKDIKIPDLILLEYPNLVLEVTKVIKMANSYNNYNSTNLQVSFGQDFLNDLIKHYLGEFNDYKNMFVSPLYASNKMIENFPRVRFFIGDKDISRDSFMRGIYYFRNAKNIRAYDFIGLYHGFNGIDDPDIFEMVKDFVVEEVKDILH
jgi:acetyl esterase/lipase